MLYGALLISSILLQAAAVIQTLRLLRLTGWRTPWLLLALAILFMLASRCSDLYLHLGGHAAHPPQVLGEMLAALVSLLLLMALIRLQPVIASAEDLRQQLIKSRRQLGQAQQMARMGFWEWNLISDEFNCSEEMACMLGCKEDKSDRSFQGLLEHVHPDERLLFQERMNQAMYEKKPFDLKHRLLAKDGVILNIWHQAEVIHDQAGRPEYVYGILQDITEKTLADERLAKTNADLRQQQMELAHATRMATLGEMASGIAHEINQPLGAILIYANGARKQLADTGMSREQGTELFEQIVTQAERASEIIKRMRAFVRKEEANIQEIELPVLFERVINFINATTRSQQLQFETAYPPDLPTVWADTIQVEQVITNLILNAIEAMEQANTWHQLIRIEAAVEDEKFVSITVCDSGPGIPEEIREHMFDPFFTSKSKGLGLGLSICKTIIGNYGGTLELVTDTERSGACFRFTLPRHGEQP